MRSRSELSKIGLALVAVFALGAAPAWAQQHGQAGKPKEHKEGGQPTVTLDAALSATKEILVKQGFEVLSVETKGDQQIVTYRAGNQGKGKGKGPPVRMVIRRVENQIVLDDAPAEVKLEVGIKLGIKL